MADGTYSHKVACDCSHASPCNLTCRTTHCMGLLTHLFYPWGLLLQAGAIIHFIRRRPDTYWLYIILFLGPIGAIVYLFAEVFPDVGLLNQSFKGISRRKRIAALELTIRDIPSAGNYEELGDLCLEDGKLSGAEAYNKAIAARWNERLLLPSGRSAIQLGDRWPHCPTLRA